MFKMILFSDVKYMYDMLQSLYHHGLLDQSVAVFTHVLQDLVSSIVAGCGGGLGGHSQGVDQSLESSRQRIQQFITVH